MIKHQFYSHAELPPVQLLFSGEEECAPSHEFGGKRPYLMIHTIVKGRGTFYWGRKSWSLGEGDAFLIFPEQIHLYRADGSDPWHYFWLALDRSLVPYLAERGISQDQPVLKSPRPRDTYALYQSLMPRREEKVPGWEMAVYASVYRILGDLLSHPERRRPQSSADISPDHVKSMKLFMDNYFQTPISVKDVTSYVSLERSYASRLFKEGTGRGIAGYIRTLRLEQSREYLQEGFTVKQAAYSAGFQIYENFLKLFKRQYGLTPGAYRKKTSRKKGN